MFKAKLKQAEIRDLNFNSDIQYFDGKVKVEHCLETMK